MHLGAGVIGNRPSEHSRHRINRRARRSTCSEGVQQGLSRSIRINSARGEYHGLPFLCRPVGQSFHPRRLILLQHSDPEGVLIALSGSRGLGHTNHHQLASRTIILGGRPGQNSGHGIKARRSWGTRRQTEPQTRSRTVQIGGRVGDHDRLALGHDHG